jgi:hypothetical protein
MSQPRLPTRATDAWDCGFILDQASVVRGVSARGGLVVAGGDLLYMQRPGAEKMASREPPLDAGNVVIAAAEARAPWRYAFASEALVAIFFKNKTEDGIVRLRPAEQGGRPTHLAWARDGHGDGHALYIRWDDGAIVRTMPDMSGVDVLDFPPVDAIASDSSGVLAMVTFTEEGGRAYVSHDGTHFAFRELDVPHEAGEHVHLAVADEAVAVALGQRGAYLSRAAGAPFVRCEHLTTAGPIELEGASSDAALFGAIRTPTVAAILRIDPAGAAIRVAEFESDGPVPELTALSWDAQRRKLWGASPQMGIVTCTAPDAKRGKKALQS